MNTSDFLTRYFSKVTCLKFFCTPFLLFILCFIEADEWVQTININILPTTTRVKHELFYSKFV